MWTLVALGALTWLATGLLAAAVLGRSIRLADRHASVTGADLFPAHPVPTPTG